MVSRSMQELNERIHEAAEAIRSKWNRQPKVGVILGTGLGGSLEAEIDSAITIPYGDIPHFPEATVTSHAGQLVCGQWAGTTIVAMEGRFHYYEGHSMQEITFPVRVMRELGADLLVVSAACGAMNAHYTIGDLVIVEDHINLMGDNPLIGPNDDRLGPRFPDMCQPYDQDLVALAEQVGLAEGISCHRGVYVAVAGPNLETRAEYRFLRTIGADVVGMSTVPEVIVAAHAGLRVLGVVAVTDMCLPDALTPVNLDEIIEAANMAAPKLRKLVHQVLIKL